MQTFHEVVGGWLSLFCFVYLYWIKNCWHVSLAVQTVETGSNLSSFEGMFRNHSLLSVSSHGQWDKTSFHPSRAVLDAHSHSSQPTWNKETLWYPDNGTWSFKQSCLTSNETDWLFVSWCPAIAKPKKVQGYVLKVGCPLSTTGVFSGFHHIACVLDSVYIVTYRGEFTAHCLCCGGFQGLWD